MKPQPGKPDPPAPTQLAVRFVASLDADRRLYKHDIAGSIAHARMLETVGLITTEERARIEQGLKQIEVQIDDQGDAWPGWRPELEDVHMCVEAALIKKIGDAARKLHTGRSRNDQVALDLKLLVLSVRNTLAARWDRRGDKPMGLNQPPSASSSSTGPGSTQSSESQAVYPDADK